MILDITLPKKKSYKSIALDTKKYFKRKENNYVFEDDKKSFYIYICKKRMTIQMTETTLEVKSNVEKYLEYIFNGQYIGIPKNETININLKNVEVYYI